MEQITMKALCKMKICESVEWNKISYIIYNTFSFPEI